jgi:hypothetical protein
MLTGSAASQGISRIFGTRRFITVLTSARQPSLSWANSIKSPQLPPTSWRSILILSSHLRLGLPIVLFPSGFPTRTLCTTLHYPIRATCPAHLILLDFTTRTILGTEYRSLSFVKLLVPQKALCSIDLGVWIVMYNLLTWAYFVRESLEVWMCIWFKLKILSLRIAVCERKEI